MAALSQLGCHVMMAHLTALRHFLMQLFILICSDPIQLYAFLQMDIFVALRISLLMHLQIASSSKGLCRMSQSSFRHSMWCLEFSAAVLSLPGCHVQLEHMNPLQLFQIADMFQSPF